MNAGEWTRPGKRVLRRLLRRVSSILYRLGFWRFREARLRLFRETFCFEHGNLVLDVGAGRGYVWRRFFTNGDRPRVVAVDYSAIEKEHQEVFACFVRADGCILPFGDGAFDLVWSNSTIEHVGDAARQAAFARELRRVGRAYFVQVPNRWFPLEPHTLLPLVSFLPYEWSNWIYRNLLGRRDYLRLLSYAQVQSLFPEATIVREKVFGLTKSLVAFRRLPRENSSAPD